jgi:hypothetical protein
MDTCTGGQSPDAQPHPFSRVRMHQALNVATSASGNSSIWRRHSTSGSAHLLDCGTQAAEMGCTAFHGIPHRGVHTLPMGLRDETDALACRGVGHSGGAVLLRLHDMQPAGGHGSYVHCDAWMPCCLVLMLGVSSLGLF